MAPEVSIKNNTLGSAPLRKRSTGFEVALQHLLRGNILSSLGLGSSVWNGRHFLYSTSVARIAGGTAMAIIKGFDVSIVWAARREVWTLSLIRENSSCMQMRPPTVAEDSRGLNDRHPTSRPDNWPYLSCEPVDGCIVTI